MRHVQHRRMIDRAPSSPPGTPRAARGNCSGSSVIGVICSRSLAHCSGGRHVLDNRKSLRSNRNFCSSGVIRSEAILRYSPRYPDPLPGGGDDRGAASSVSRRPRQFRPVRFPLQAALFRPLRPSESNNLRSSAAAKSTRIHHIHLFRNIRTRRNVPPVLRIFPQSREGRHGRERICAHKTIGRERPQFFADGQQQRQNRQVKGMHDVQK